MNDSQMRAYWAEWRNCSSALKALGHPGDDYQRKALQADAIGGVEKSSAKLTNAELTRVLAKFRSYSKPADFAAQMHAEEEPGEKRAATLREIERLAEARGVRGGLKGVSSYFKKFLAEVPVEKATGDKLRRLLYVLKNRPGKAPASPALSASPAPAKRASAAEDEFRVPGGVEF